MNKMERGKLFIVLAGFLVLLPSFVFSVQGLELGKLQIRINNCLESFSFVSCKDVIGVWEQKPPSTIANYTRGTFTIRPKSGISHPTLGNCTFTYRNGHGLWTAFVDWDWALLGDQSYGGGTNDERDKEVTQLSTKGELEEKACFWFHYAGDWLNCYVKTHETECPQPQNGPRITLKKNP